MDKALVQQMEEAYSSLPVSPRVTHMLDEVEDMEVDYPQNPFYQGSLARTSTSNWGQCLQKKEKHYQ